MADNGDVLDDEDSVKGDLVSATNTTNVNIPQMADTLFERSTNASWVVVFKALVTTHHMCVYGNERFIQYLASRTSLFNLSNFIDKTGSHGYDMSTFIRRYGRYLNEKAFAYRQMAFDFTRVKKGAEGVMRTMTTEKLLKGMPVLQTQIDTLLEFDVHPKELNNGIINAAFMLLFKDLVKLFASYNDGIINLLEKYFKMKKSDCKEALEIYKRFLTRVTKIGEFMKLAETVGVEKNDIPDINYCLHPGVVVDLADSDDEDCPFKPLEEPAPSSILESLETHMNGLEDVKGGKKGSPTKGSPTNNVSPTSTPAKSSNAVPTLQPPPGESGAGAAAAAPEPAEDSLLDLDPLSSSGPSAPSAAPTSWGEMGDSLLSEPTLTAEPTPSPAAAAPTPAAAESGVSLAPPTSTAAATSPGTANMDLLGDPFAPSSGNTNAAASGLDLFTMMTAENNNLGSSLDPCFSSVHALRPRPINVHNNESKSIVGVYLCEHIKALNIIFTLPSPADLFISPAPILSSAPPPKIDTGAIMNLFGAVCLTLNIFLGISSVKSKADYYPFFALMLRWKWLTLLWLDMVWFAILWVDLAESTGGDAPAAAASTGAELMSVFDGLGEVMKPIGTPQAGDVDTSMANMASTLTMGSSAAPQTVSMGVPSFMGTHPSFSRVRPSVQSSPVMPLTSHYITGL
ncbi:Clathrin coat assembly protein AP180 [Channa argus]|uniref:Clathrin coat assembly protein AP180 n=1 Tax=Channa argus TaxID=215402 RepID=A0A6G1QJV6_CHAAH|nr:Clathrin coat assembly protein AP180 [Channa argus]